MLLLIKKLVKKSMKLIEIIGLEIVHAKKLEKEGIHSVKDLLPLSSYDIKKLAKKTGISAKLIDTWQEHADLMRIKGITPEYANIINLSGVNSVKQLARRNPKTLLDKIVTLKKEQPDLLTKVPSFKEVTDWVSEAKNDGNGPGDPIEIPNEKKNTMGSKVRVWEQDPTVSSPTLTYLHTLIQDGPKDGDINIVGLPIAKSDNKNDFLYDHKKNPKKFDAVHTFTVIRQVITMYNRALLKQNDRYSGFQWQWGKDQINVYPYAEYGANAYYSRDEQALKFFYFHPNDDQSKPLVYTCRSFDIVAHETGHAFLDALCPEFLISWHPETGGLHESFGDLTSIFMLLAQFDICDAIVAESKADLHNKTFFPIMGEQFGEALFGKSTGLRNADNDLKMSQVSTEVHEISQVFTGAVYDILADMFDSHLNLDRYDPAETLYRVGYHMALLIINALFLNKHMNATYQEVAQSMISLEQNDEYKAFILSEFTKREILGVPVSEPDIHLEYSYKGCCQTLQNEEFKKHILTAKKK